MNEKIKKIKLRCDRNIINKKKIVKQISEYDYISFDIFDTLLKRNVSEPKDVFKLMVVIQPELNKEFPSYRINAEQEARKKKNGKEVTLREIYQCLNDYTDTQKEKLMQLEMETEKSVLVPNLPMIEIYNTCIENKKEVLITSDMYLPLSFVEEVLRLNGITGYKKLYLSSDTMCTKSDGTLFSLILKEQNISPAQLLHIGDSIVSDCINPRKHGIHSCYIPGHLNNTERINHNLDGKLSMSLLNSMVNNNVCKFTNWYEAFGYDSFGVFLYGFSRWLYQNLKNEGIQKVYFFSRDGYIMKKAFDTTIHDDSISTFYLEVSRRSLRIPVLWMDSSFKTLLSMISPSKLISLRSVFDGAGLEIEEYLPLINQYGFDSESSFDRSTIMENTALTELYEQLIPAIEEVSKKEYVFLKKYLMQNKISGKFAIVDIGWSGGMQRYLSQTLDKLEIKHEIYGYYIGIADYYKRNTSVVNDLRLKGYLFDFKNNKNEQDKRSSFVGLFESLFLEQDGSVKNYHEEKGTITALRYPYEYIIDGKPSVELNNIRKLQEGAMKFLKDAVNTHYLDYFQYSADELFYGIYKTGCNPTADDIRKFGDFKFFDEGVTNKLASPRTIFYYAVHPNAVKKDFLESRWKVGFMKKLFKVKAPYNKLYKALLRFK